MSRFRSAIVFGVVLLVAAVGIRMFPRSSVATLATTSPSSSQQATEPRPGLAIVIVDMSKSFAPLDGTKVSALKAVTDGLYEVLTKSWPSGSVYVTTIAASSLRTDGPCGPPMVYKQQLLHLSNGKARGTSITTPDVLTQWFQECVGLVKKRSEKPEMHTDISGAVAMAAEAAREVSGPKLLCVVSDFVEDLPQGNKPAQFVLSGERVLMLWAPQETDATDPNQMFARIKGWEDHFRKAGASQVVTAPVTGFTAGSLQRWISQ